MTGSLKDQTVLVVGRGSGLARAITLAALDAGARVVAAGRSQEVLSAAYADEPGVSTELVDLTDEASIAVLAERLGPVDHVVSTASARARGRLADLDRDAIRLSFDTKVIGPLMLAKHLAPRMNQGGSFVLFSGVAAAKIAVGTLGVAITNAAADTLARSLALELARSGLTPSPRASSIPAPGTPSASKAGPTTSLRSGPITPPGGSALPMTSPKASCSP
jgi:NAD(P)-dependent dehydrogenase (short-subunit alcohol dehydrogenase family)